VSETRGGTARPRRSGAAFVLLASILPAGCHAQVVEPAVVRDAYRHAVARSRDSTPPTDNLDGAIVWQEAYVLQSLIDMYGATGDTSYLSTFVRRADAVIRVRDDVAGRKEWNGGQSMGWQTADGYTFGGPIVLEDEHGDPSLSVRAIHMTDNDSTRIEVTHSDGTHYTLRVTNTAERGRTAERTYGDLTQETVERTVDGDLTPYDWIHVTVLGAGAPAVTDHPRLFEADRTVLSTFHDAFIMIPFTRFASVVLRGGVKAFEAPARRYAAMADTIFRRNAPYWVDRGAYGYYRIEPSAPFWMAGIAAPTNVQSANGLYLTELARATGDTAARHRAEQLLELIRRIGHVTPDGAYSFPYLFLQGNTGWGPGTGVPRPMGSLYASYRGRDAADDASHGAWTAQFVWTAHEASLGLTDREMAHWRATAAAMIPSAGPAGLRVASRLPGGTDAGAPGRFDYTAPTWALFAVGGDSTLAGRAARIYRERYADAGSSVVQMGWARLAWLASLLEKASP
jgi:hypothetical protein